MTHDEALEVLRLQLVLLAGIADPFILHGPVDSNRRTKAWITLIPLAATSKGRPVRKGTTLEHAHTASVLVTAYGSAAVDGLRAAESEIQADTPNGTIALGSKVTLDSVSPASFVPVVVRTANEPRVSVTIAIGYVFSRTVVEPVAADAITVDLTADDNPPIVAAIIVGV